MGSIRNDGKMARRQRTGERTRERRKNGGRQDDYGKEKNGGAKKEMQK